MTRKLTAVRANTSPQTCYGVSFASDEALPRDRRTLLTGDVLGRYKYACAGVSRRAAPFYKERTPTIEDRKRGTEFPYCTGLEILVAEKVIDRRTEGAREGASSTTTTTSRPEGVDVEVVLDDARDDDDGVASAGRRRGDGHATVYSDALDRFNRSAGKITRNMSRHANFIADGVLSLILGRR